MNKAFIGVGIATIITQTIIGLGDEEAQAYSLPNYYVTRVRLNVRSCPSVKDGIIYTTLDSQQMVKAVEWNKDYTWALIEYGENGKFNRSGWVYAKYIKVYEDDLEYDVKTKYRLNLRTEPNTVTGKVIKTLPKNTPLIILEQRDEWLYVKPLDGVGIRGWVSGRYVTR